MTKPINNGNARRYLLSFLLYGLGFIAFIIAILMVSQWSQNPSSNILWAILIMLIGAGTIAFGLFLHLTKRN